MQKITKVYNRGKVLNQADYEKLQHIELNNPNFKGCGNEFKENRDWWVIKNTRGRIIAYCGSIYTHGFVIFNRAWVDRKYRGKGIQKSLIKIRLKSAARYGNTAITYTLIDNFPSANSLISCGFKLYAPEYAYAGKNVLYFQKKLR
jgi:GNAT superfamily N-acetyltransferase